MSFEVSLASATRNSETPSGLFSTFSEIRAVLATAALCKSAFDRSRKAVTLTLRLLFSWCLKIISLLSVGRRGCPLCYGDPPQTYLISTSRNPPKAGPFLSKLLLEPASPYAAPVPIRPTTGPPLSPYPVPPFLPFSLFSPSLKWMSCRFEVPA